MNNRLLPVGSSPLEVAAAAALSSLADIPVPIRDLWNPDRCPVRMLPYLAWAWSVDRWDMDWPEQAKRDAIKAAMFVHKHKGTIGAIRRVVEPFGYLIRVIEWWQTNETPGTFRLDIGVMETGITETTYYELERLIFDAKPASRHLIGMSIQLETGGTAYCAVTSYDGDVLTVYPYVPELITVTGTDIVGAGVHIIDDMRIKS
ncbi:phage tail protein I [Xenorhabdus szentirmaii]|uniref:Tail protein I n=1 Tax=Xenorhabdus szentirmaii DSM 16338 TaxID=1427518 RepID=W1J5X6_9GAMM|nr:MULTISPECIES: phage tail protein I [Xenorhabdus]MBD2806575.1 phage tail protein I [Xenorhabdus sp. ZM]MBD2825594.1 phage tail protein I [Xenorhabdus sp. 5]PHM32031.1 phage tail protein I [Xenorhabdus szentirmaii DSM 16338]CDL85438.1 Tail protein I [Xenorhabdus szentirmaii DSM 16338]